MILALTLAALSANAPSARAMTFRLDSETRVFQLGVNIAIVTDVKTPVDCLQAIGDPEYFAAVSATPRRFVITVISERPGASTNVTFDCAEGVRFALELKQVPVDDAVALVDFALAAEETARVQAAVETERKRCATEAEQRTFDLRDTLLREAQEQLVGGMLRRFSANDDEESARQDFVIIHVTQEIVAGDRAYVLFAVQNRTSKEVVMRDVEILSGDDGPAMAGSLLVMSEKRVPPSATRFAVAVFDAPEDLSSVTLVVHEDGPRKISIDDIDF